MVGFVSPQKPAKQDLPNLLARARSPPRRERLPQVLAQPPFPSRLTQKYGFGQGEPAMVSGRRTRLDPTKSLVKACNHGETQSKRLKPCFGSTARLAILAQLPWETRQLGFPSSWLPMHDEKTDRSTLHVDPFGTASPCFGGVQADLKRDPSQGLQPNFSLKNKMDGTVQNVLDWFLSQIAKLKLVEAESIIFRPKVEAQKTPIVYSCAGKRASRCRRTPRTIDT